MRQEPFRLSADGHFEARDTSDGGTLASWSRIPTRGAIGAYRGRWRLTVERIEFIGERVNQFPRRVFSQQLDREKLAHHGPSLTHAAVSGIQMDLLRELKTVRYQRI